jgi:hypothetical protein
LENYKKYDTFKKTVPLRHKTYEDMEQQFYYLFGKGGAYEMMYNIFLYHFSSILLRKHTPHELFLMEEEKRN